MLSRTAMCIQHQALTRSNAVLHRTASRSMHLTCRIRSSVLGTQSVLKISNYTPVLGAYSKRYASTKETETEFLKIIETPGKSVAPSADSASSASSVPSGLDAIPDVPVPPVQTALDTVSYLGEPSFASMGLTGWTPPGLVRMVLEQMHVSMGLPWWECIVIATVILRIALFPLVVMSQRTLALMHNTSPQTMRIQMDIQEARMSGDQFSAARYSQELQKHMADNGIKMWKNLLVPLAQAPIFLSCYLALREMAAYPVESLKEGGLWWFTDLTVIDPYYILPLITTATLMATIELGTDGARAEAMGNMKHFVRFIPIIAFPFIINFPAATLCYWTSANFMSLLTVGLMRIPKVRTFFKIPQLVTHPPAKRDEKGFVQGFRTSMSNFKKMRELNARTQADEVQFYQAGRGPVIKTYPYDPTKQTTAHKKANAILAKKK